MNYQSLLVSLAMVASIEAAASVSEAGKSRQLRVAYVETNETSIEVAGKFKDSRGKPIFDMAVIFAANINSSSSEKRAVIFLNPKVREQLTQRSAEIRALQRQGIKVLLSILGNHQDAGWSCFKNYEEGERFAADLKQLVEKYQLDGIDIDDEYSKCTATYPDSLVRVTTAMRKLMPTLIISKALWMDTKYFDAEWKGRRLADNLDYAWEMAYESSKNCLQRVSAYLERGMSKDRIGVGASTLLNTPAEALALDQCSRKNGLGTAMTFNLDEKSETFLRGSGKY